MRFSSLLGLPQSRQREGEGFEGGRGGCRVRAATRSTSRDPQPDRTPAVARRNSTAPQRARNPGLRSSQAKSFATSGTSTNRRSTHSYRARDLTPLRGLAKRTVRVRERIRNSSRRAGTAGVISFCDPRVTSRYISCEDVY